MRAKKSFGQNWLRDEYTLSKIVDAAGVSNKDTVLEVGPGLGTLTAKLVERAKTVVAVEADQDLLPVLAATFATTENIQLVQGDILQYNLLTLAAGYKVVANIPYYLTSHLIRNLLESTNPPESMVLLIQKEVAERIVATPGKMSVLSFSVQYYAQPEIVEYVSRELFSPVPKVDSAIIRITKRQSPAFEADTKVLFRLVKAGFGEKRKMLRNSLSGGLKISLEQSEQLLVDAEIIATARAQELSIAQWHRLYSAYTGIL